MSASLFVVDKRSKTKQETFAFSEWQKVLFVVLKDE